MGAATITTKTCPHCSREHASNHRALCNVCYRTDAIREIYRSPSRVLTLDSWIGVVTDAGMLARGFDFDRPAAATFTRDMSRLVLFRERYAADQALAALARAGVRGRLVRGMPSPTGLEWVEVAA
jgi:hypothetical protein